MIDKNILLIDLLREYPEARDILEKYGMNCAECLGVSTGTLEDAARIHGLDIENLMEELKSALKCK